MLMRLDKALDRLLWYVVWMGAMVSLGGGGGCNTATPSFSSLSPAKQAQFRQVAEATPLRERSAPYSTPMYYLMHEGYRYQGDEDKDPDGRCYPSMKGKLGPDFGSWRLDRNRADWQEVMLRDFAELGMTQTHLNVYPVDGELELSPSLKQALKDYVRLSEKYGLRVGVRLDGIDETVLWSVHPENPKSRRAAYLKWVESVAACLSGQTAYYILGDELTLKADTTTRPAKSWTPAMYLSYFKEVKAAIVAKDPGAKVCMFSASSGEWFNVTDLLSHGYAEVGDGVAINHYNWRELGRFLLDRDRLAPGKLFLTSGVGYISNGMVSKRYPEGDAYSKCPTESAHAAEIARTMYAWWEQGADNAPYYVSLRNWVIDGRIYPRWFGFFGFEDYVIEKGVMHVNRYPGWYAYQAVAQTFYDRKRCLRPAFNVSASPAIEKFDAFERSGSKGKELLIMAWNNQPKTVRIKLGTLAYGFPVKVSLANAANWEDLKWGYDSASDSGQRETWVEIPVSTEPMIIRMFPR